jgi:hypothetical protein
MISKWMRIALWTVVLAVPAQASRAVQETGCCPIPHCPHCCH